jgi:hypothetical protein
MVQVAYRVRPGAEREFVRAMQPLRDERLRDGAVSWGLFVAVSDPARYVETFVLESWVEHLRQHERVTVADRAVQADLLSFTEERSNPVVSHLIAATSSPVTPRHS